MFSFTPPPSRWVFIATSKYGAPVEVVTEALVQARHLRPQQLRSMEADLKAKLRARDLQKIDAAIDKGLGHLRGGL